MRIELTADGVSARRLDLKSREPTRTHSPPLILIVALKLPFHPIPLAGIAAFGELFSEFGKQGIRDVRVIQAEMACFLNAA